MLQPSAVDRLLALPAALPSMAAARSAAQVASYWRRMNQIRETLIPKVRRAVVQKLLVERRLIDRAFHLDKVPIGMRAAEVRSLKGTNSTDNLIFTSGRSSHRKLFSQQDRTDFVDLEAQDEILVDFSSLLDAANKTTGFEQKLQTAFASTAESFTVKSQSLLGLQHPGFGPAQQQWIDNRVTKIVDQMDRTTQISLNRAVREGLEKGWTKDQLREEIRQTYNGWTRSRPDTIARTETGIISGRMQDEMMRGGAIPTDRLEKIWVTARDNRVRDTHEPLESFRVPYNDPFPNGLMYPHDENGPAGEVINCRCILMFEEAAIPQGVRETEFLDSFRDPDFNFEWGRPTEGDVIRDFDRLQFLQKNEGLKISSMMHEWDSHFPGMSPKMVAESMGKDLLLKYGKSPTIAGHPPPRMILRYVEGRDLSAVFASKEISMHRILSFHQRIVEHELLSISPALQKTGIAKAILSKQIEFYQSLGYVNKVWMTANLDVGGYAWARYGFVPATRAEWTLLKQTVKSKKSTLPDHLLLPEGAGPYADPKAIRLLAATPDGKEALLGTSWIGKLDLTDQETMSMFWNYVRR